MGRWPHVPAEVGLVGPDWPEPGSSGTGLVGKARPAGRKQDPYWAGAKHQQGIGGERQCLGLIGGG